jgi:diacylglycerol kinase (ATP)
MNTTKTLIILNPHAGSGRAGRLWAEIEPLLWQELGELVVAVTQKPDEVAQHLEKAREIGLTRVIAIGGDGTNFALINELIRLNKKYPGDPPMTFGSLPIGTGRDWARTLGIPLSPVEAVKWIKAAHPAPLDVGQLTIDEHQAKYFLNIASVGITGVIAESVNKLPHRRLWTFYQKTVQALLAYKPPIMTVKIDGKVWREGRTYACAIANGQTFGRGMKVAPQAAYDDGLCDVILFEGIARLNAVIAFNTIYSGAHLKRGDVHMTRAKTVEIEAAGERLTLELDGESTQGDRLRFEVLPQALNTLVGKPATA